MIYLDNNASTPPDGRVIERFVQISSDIYANPSNNTHTLGAAAEQQIESARARIGEKLGLDRREIFFTSGSTESINIALYGFGLRSPLKRDIAFSKVEHPAVLSTAENLAKISGGRSISIDVNSDGRVNSDSVKGNVDESTSLLCVMAANNETGVIQPHDEIREIASSTGTPIFVDITQAIGKIELQEAWLAAEAGCFSGHKIYGLKNSGILWIRRELQKDLFKISQGGGQQRLIRGGTQNPAMAECLALSVEIALDELTEVTLKYRQLSSSFLSELTRNNINYEIAGDGTERLPQTLMLRIPGIDTDLLQSRLNTVAISQASACHSGDDNPSHVLLAMGYERSVANQFFRVSFGKQNTIEESIGAAKEISKVVEAIKRGGL